VNEAFIRLVDAQAVCWPDRAHFLGTAARLMRRVLVHHARSLGYQNHGGGALKVTLTGGLAVPPEPTFNLMALDRAFDRLAPDDERKAKGIVFSAA
jgi:RNA polymerase sigma-70 factor, ECF subfamily